MTGPHHINISDHLAIVFWTLIVPFSLLFQRNSHSEGEYFPLSGFCPIIRGKSGYLKGVSHQISFVCSLLQISASMVRSLHEESCTFTFSTVGSQGHERRCLRTLVSLHQWWLQIFASIVKNLRRGILMMSSCASGISFNLRSTNNLVISSCRKGCRDMTRRSWHLRARFCKNVWKNPEKLRLIFDGKQVFEPLGGQIGLKIGMHLQFNDI